MWYTVVISGHSYLDWGAHGNSLHGECTFVTVWPVDWQQDNILHGRYLAELTKEVLVDLEASKYQHAEYRISIYGRKYVEWDILAAWYCQNKLYSDNVLWLIQVWYLVLSTVLLEAAQVIHVLVQPCVDS